MREDLRSKDMVFVMPYHIPRRRQSELPLPSARAFFPPLPASSGLDTALHGTAFIEYPVIHVYARDEWDRAMRAGTVVVMASLQPRRRPDEGAEKVEEGERPAKKAKVEIEVNALAGLGDYGHSDEESGDGEDAEGVDGAEGDEEGAVEETVDITLDPAMAAALGQALQADFGEA